MSKYIVLYRPAGADCFSEPLGFRCEADDLDHAEEQMSNFEPTASIVWAVETDNLATAIDDYYGWGNIS